MVQVYNSLTRQKEPLVPIVAGKLGFYVCGMTVYDDCHLGHARSMVCFDVIVRTLQMAGFDVTYIRNITDVDDKIIARALVQGVSVETLTQTCMDSMHRDAAALNCIAPTHEPRATESMVHIIQFIEALIDANVAYIADSGDVCFEVSRFPDYGKLSNMDLDKLLAGIRVDVAQSKRSALDFVLWKQAKPDEPQWPSPWGAGRPGWHIECSAMSKHALGETFDLHGGGLDLKFPHHENEIAQSEALSHKPLANYWLHVGLLQINEQ
ncbi:MAG: cysteine--tRNA ligase, partial [Legionella sp. 21-45-4]